MVYIHLSRFLLRLLILSCVICQVFSEVEVCSPNNNATSIVFTLNRLQCPKGVLFAEPLQFGCIQMSSSTDTTEWKENVCDDIAFSSTNAKVQLLVGLDDEILPLDESCVGTDVGKCNGQKLAVTNLNLKPAEKSSDEESYVPTAEDQLLTNDTAVVDQTERLLKFLHGLLEEPEDESPVLRVTDLLTKSFNIIGGFCAAPFLSKDFMDEILKSFYFILRESDTNRIQDITSEEYDRIEPALASCLGDVSRKDELLLLNGIQCKTFPKIKQVKAPPQPMFDYKRDSNSFRLNKYDIVTDATWGVIDFIHGMCFSKFSPHFNSHHLYQQAMERLFTDEIVYRWSRPTVLTSDEAWDAVFLGNVKSNMRNMDACIHGAYSGKPYLHRLERILVTQQRSSSRRKRSLTDGNSLDGAGWCFQTDSEKETVLNELCNNTATAAL